MATTVWPLLSLYHMLYVFLGWGSFSGYNCKYKKKIYQLCFFRISDSSICKKIFFNAVTVANSGGEDVSQASLMAV